INLYPFSLHDALPIYLLLMMISSLPLYSIVFLFGGVHPNLLLSTFLLYLVVMITIGSLGVLFSTLIRKTIIASITTYGVALFLTAGTGFLMIIIGEMFFYQNSATTVPYSTAMVKPFIL